MKRITKKRISELFSIDIDDLNLFIKENNIKAFKVAGYMYYDILEILENTNFSERYINTDDLRLIYNDIILSNSIDKSESRLSKIILDSFVKNNSIKPYSLFKERQSEIILIKDAARNDKMVKKSILERELKKNFSESINLSKDIEYNKIKYVLHIGPTNSGKTYNALEDLKINGGVYLSPLRLLAWEIFERFNKDGINCSLITGEEEILKENSHIISSTIEMFNYNRNYKTVIIDECFMINDKDRGKSWFKAITSIKSDTIHLICNIESEFIITKILKTIGRDNIEIKRYDRLVKLETTNIKQSKPPKRTILVTFSRINVLRYKSIYEDKGYKVSILYGNLPPEIKRNEILKFISGETDICISTDIIGMGLNIPCDNIIFLDLSKFDGHSNRKLTNTEVKQISGRAGRFGLSDIGYVSSQNNKFINDCLTSNIRIEKAYLGFDYRFVLNIGVDFGMINIINTWRGIDFIPNDLKSYIEKESIDKYTKLVNDKVENIKKTNPDIAWNLIYSPVKDNNISVYNDLVKSINSNSKYKFISYPLSKIKDIDELKLNEDILSKMELYLYFYNNPIFRDYLDINDEGIEKLKIKRYDIIEQITKFLLNRNLSKRKVCQNCKKDVGINWVHKLCNNCFRKSRRYDDYDDYDDYLTFS